MKYYNFNNALIVVLAQGLSIRCTVETVVVNGHLYERLWAEFTYITPVFKDLPPQYSPLTKKQAVCFYLRLRARDGIYQCACEIWMAMRRKKKTPTSADDIMSSVLLGMAEQELDLRPLYKNEPFAWRKSILSEN